MRRELMEEMAIDVTKEAAVGVINDDSTEVGYVHLGVVHIVNVRDRLRRRRQARRLPYFKVHGEGKRRGEIRMAPEILIRSKLFAALSGQDAGRG